MKNMKTAVIFCRVSSISDRQSNERQVLELKRYAESNQLQVAKIFEERISGATPNTDRTVLQEALTFCQEQKIDILLSNELSRIGRSTFDVLETIKFLIDHRINLHLQKESFTLLGEDMRPSPFAAIMIATLSTCAEFERENIKYRLCTGRRVFIEKGGKLGRKKGSCKSKEKKENEYKMVLAYLKKGYTVKVTSALCGKSISTVQRLKKEFEL